MHVFSPIRSLASLILAPAFLVPIPAFSQAPLVDITPPDVGSTLSNIGGGWADFDGDGDLDISASVFSGAGHLLLHRNDGGEQFVSVGDSLLPAPAGNSSGAAWGDYDGDGDLDAVCTTSGSPQYLFRNDGNGFVDRSAGDLADNGSGGRTANWVDIDLDGDLDVFLANTGGNKLYRNDGNDVFQDITTAVVLGGSQAVAWADYDNDGDMDLYVGRQSVADVMARNDGDGTFTDVTIAAGLGNTGSNLGVAWGDYNNDGHPDVHLANGGSGDALYRNNGDGTFTDVFAPIPVRGGGGTMVGSNWGDYDLDGDLDVFVGGYFGAGSLLLRNDGNDSFVNEADSVLAAQFADGGAWGDFDGDGDLDLFIPTEGAADALFRNDTNNGNRWLQLALVGTASNASAIGARVRATAGGSSQFRQVHSSSGWGQHNSLDVEFGFGSTSSVDEVEIRWPSGVIQRLQSVPTNQKQTIRERLVASPPSYAIGAAVDVGVPLGSVVTSATLAYRIAGSGATFDSLAMNLANDVATATVPANRATDRGIEGHVIWTNTNGHTTSLPIFVAATLPAQALPAIPAPEQHLLFGFPFQPTSPSPAAAVEDELGPPDNTKWRLGRWSQPGNRYLEHPGDALNMSAGNGFWLIQKNPVAVSSTGTTVSTVGGFPISLPPGWTMISHPYLFSVAFANLDLSQAPNVEGRLVGFINGYANETALLPWRGYWMRNNGSTAETIIIPGTQSGPQPAPPAQLAAGDWRMEVSARQGIMTDADNVVGVSAEATELPDRLDFHEPPAFPGVVRVFFENPDAASSVHELSQDLRPDRVDGNAWDLVIDAPEGDPVHVSFSGVAGIDAAEAAWLIITEDTWAVTDLRERAELTLPAGRTYRFRLVVGSESFAESVSTGQDRLPVAFALGVGYPNPFAAQTSFGLALPRQASVELTVYDVTGRRVKTLLSGPLSAGRHTVSWNATDEAGQRVAPGVYFAKMTSEGFDGSRKVVVLQ